NHGDHTNEGTLNRENIQPLQFEPYSKERTKQLMQSFFEKKIWAKEPPAPGFKFDAHCYDLLVDLEPGVWVRGVRMVLPGMVVAVVEFAIETARGGDVTVQNTAQCALEAFEELRNEQPKIATDKEKYAPILSQAEVEVRALLPSPKRKGFAAWFGSS